MDNKTKILIGLGIVLALGGVGLSFVNYRKKQIKRQAYLFEGIKEVGNNAGFSSG